MKLLHAATGLSVALLGFAGLAGVTGAAEGIPRQETDAVPWVVCTQGTAYEGESVIDEALVAPWAPVAPPLEPGDPEPAPESNPENLVQPPITDGMIVEGRGAGTGTTYEVKIDHTCGTAVPNSNDAVVPWVVCTQGTAYEGESVIDEALVAPWAPVAPPLEPGDPEPAPESNPENLVQPPITDGMIVEGRGAGTGTTYEVKIDHTCGAAAPSSTDDTAPATTVRPTTTAQPKPTPPTLKPSFTG